MHGLMETDRCDRKNKRRTYQAPFGDWYPWPEARSLVRSTPDLSRTTSTNPRTGHSPPPHRSRASVRPLAEQVDSWRALALRYPKIPFELLLTLGGRVIPA